MIVAEAEDSLKGTETSEFLEFKRNKVKMYFSFRIWYFIPLCLVLEGLINEMMGKAP